MNQNVTLSITIPCFNEAESLPILISELEKIVVMNNLNLKDKKDIEIILVNNGSIDNTKEIINQASSEFEFIKGIHIKKNIGYGNGIFKGLISSSSDYSGWTHADLQTELNDLIKALNIIQKNKTNNKIFIKGIRIGRKV